MAQNENVEQQIREILAVETRATPLSNRLFSPDGLFNEMAKTEEQRREVARSPLFKQAQKRFLELQRAEAAAFSRALPQADAAIPGENFFIKLESTKSS